MSKTNSGTANWTTARGIAISAELTRAACRPCGPWKWTAVVRLRGYKVATLDAVSDGTFTIQSGHVPAEEHARLSAEIQSVAQAAERAYHGGSSL